MTKKTPGKTGKALLKADAAAVGAAAPYEKSGPVKILAWLSEIGDQPQLLALSGGVLALGIVRRDGRTAKAGARMIAAHLLATAAKDFVKHRVDRRRPRSAESKAGQKPKPGDSTAKEKTSFPSGHSAGAIAVARAYARECPGHRAAALAGAGAVALAQIPRCTHYPTDVGVGLAIGLAAEKAVDMVWPFGGVSSQRLDPPKPLILSSR